VKSLGKGEEVEWKNEELEEEEKRSSEKMKSLMKRRRY